VTYDWLEIPRAGGDPEALHAAASSWRAGTRDLAATTDRLGDATTAVGAGWVGDGQRAFLSTTATRTARLGGLTDLHAEAAATLASYAAALGVAQPVADRSIRAVDDALATYALEGRAAVQRLAAALEAAVAAATLPASTAGGLDPSVPVVPGALAAQSVPADWPAELISPDAVERDLAAADPATSATVDLVASTTDPGVRAALTSVVAARSWAATTIASAYNAAVQAAGGWSEESATLGRALTALTAEVVHPDATLGGGPSGPGNPTGIAAVLAAVHDPVARAALKAALKALQASPRTLDLRGLDALLAALRKVPAADRGPVITAMFQQKLLHDLAVAVSDGHLAARSDAAALQPFYDLLLTGAPQRLIASIVTTFPGVQPPLDHPNLWSQAARSGQFQVRYEPVKDPLFHKNGEPQGGDVWQGALNDCYFMSALVALVRKDPAWITDHMHDNGNGTVTVTLYLDGKPVPVTVTKDVPTRYDATGSGAGKQDGEGAGAYSYTSGVSWPELYEKAYAQLRGGYGVINAPYYPANALATLTGKTPTSSDESAEISLADLRHKLAQGESVIVGTDANTSGHGGPTLIAGHDYVIESANANGTVTLRNPQLGGNNTLTVSWSDVQSQADYLTVATLP
jgi:uncharacterized protein YukE